MANAVRLQLHALACGLANFPRTRVLPPKLAQRSTSMRCERVAKIGAKIVRHGGMITFQMTEMMVPRAMFQKIPAAILALQPWWPARC